MFYRIFVTLLSLLGFTLALSAKEGDVITPLLGLAVFTTGIFYFVVFEKELIKKHTPRLNKLNIKENISYLFLFSLFLVTLTSLNFSFITETPLLNTIQEFLKTNSAFIAAFAIIAGFVTFYLNRSVIEESTRHSEPPHCHPDLSHCHSERSEESQEQKRKEEFPTKFTKINKIPVIRNIVRWCYKEGWWHALLILSLVIFSSVIYLYNLDNHNFREDEFQVIGAATGYKNTGKFYRWDWLNNNINCQDYSDNSCAYKRAWPHSFMIAQSYKIFGISEWSSRIISVLFGIFFIIILYPITKFFTHNKKIAALVVVSAVFYPSYISLFRYTRMYALLIPLFLILCLFLYRALTEQNISQKIIQNKFKILHSKLNFHYVFVFLSLIFLYLNYHIHINSLIILPSLLVFILFMAILTKKIKYVFLSLLGIFICFMVFVAYQFGLTEKFLWALSFFERNNEIYIKHISKHPFGSDIGIILLFLGFISIFFVNKKLQYKLLYLYTIIGCSLIFFIYIGDRYSSFVYISHITTIAIITILFTTILIIKIFNNKPLILIFLMLLGTSLGTTFHQNIDRLYGDNHSYENFSQAYEIIIENYNPKSDVIIGQYLRTYYLRELANQNIKTISMLSNKRYEFETFIEDLDKYESGYITWETRKSYHIQSEIRNYIAKNFTKHHGSGIDNAGVEVYYFDQNMINKNIMQEPF